MSVTQLAYNGHLIIIIKKRNIYSWNVTIQNIDTKKIVKTIPDCASLRFAKSIAKDFIGDVKH